MRLSVGHLSSRIPLVSYMSAVCLRVALTSRLMDGAKVEISQANGLVYDIDDEVLVILLKDRTTGKNIIFATDNYCNHGYKETNEMTVALLKNRKRALIRARIDKSKEEQRIRSKEKAEVFTPSWVCNNQNNLVDNAWFGRDNVFNVEDGKGWIANTGKIEFTDKLWQDYVKDIRLEITCGEAPYLTSRYDTVTGDFIPLIERIGLLDRKLRVVSENCETKAEWIEWAKNAYKAIYGYEFQGDNLLIARENLLFNFIDYYKDKFNEKPFNELLKEIADIITWNIFQMDGLKYVVPFSCKNVKCTQYVMTNIFGEEVLLGEPENKCPGCAKNNIYEHNGKYCYIMDWEKNKRVKFLSLLKGVI